MIIKQAGPGTFVLSSNGCQLPVEAASPEKLLELIQAFQGEMEALPEVRQERANSMASARQELLAAKLEDKPKAKPKRPKRREKRGKARRPRRRGPEGEFWLNARTSSDPKQINPLVTAAIRKLSVGEWIKKNWDVVVRPPKGGSGFLFSYNPTERVAIARHYIG